MLFKLIKNTTNLPLSRLGISINVDLYGLVIVGYFTRVVGWTPPVDILLLCLLWLHWEDVLGCRDLWDLLLPIPGSPSGPKACFLWVYTGAKGCLEILSSVFNSSSVVGSKRKVLRMDLSNREYSRGVKISRKLSCYLLQWSIQFHIIFWVHLSALYKDKMLIF